MNHPSAYLLLLSLLLLYGCGTDREEGRYELYLGDTIRNETGNRYLTRRDTFAGAAADSVRQIIDRTREGRRGFYVVGWPDDEPLVTWRRDTVNATENIVRMADGVRVRVDLPATDVVLGGDSIRLGIMRVIDEAFSGNESKHPGGPDYLILTGWGTDQASFVMDQDNIGPVTRKTVFRVGRKHYYIESIDSSRRRVVIRELPDAGGLSTTAELDRAFKRVAVKDSEGRPATIEARPGRRLAMYFWSLSAHRPAGHDVLLLDSLYRALPAEKRDGLDIVLVNRTDDAPVLRAFVAENDLRLPVYLAAPNTCRKLNCRPNIPYWISVDGRGRIESFFNPPDDLLLQLKENGRDR